MANKELRLAISFRSTDDKPKRICSEPTFIKSWGPDEVENDIDVDELSKRPPWGVAAGCANGSIYLFHPDLSKTTKRQKSLKLRRLSGEGPPYRRAAHNHLSLSRSRNASPAGSRTNLAMTSTKSRAVSGLTRTEVEAPKNYVDFEEEQEKMKSMIADRSSREPKDRSPRSSIVSPVEVPSLRFDDAKSISSIPSSSSLLSPPLSPPLSPALDAQRVTHSRKHLRLHARITPRDFGHGHAIVCLDILEEGELLLALQESGKLSIFRTLDGLTVASIHPGDVASASATTVVAHGSGSRILWTWCSLYIVQTESAKFAIAVATADSRSTALDSGQADEKARVTVFELRDMSKYQLGDAQITKRHEVILENRAQGLTFSIDSSRSINIYLVDSAGQLFVRSLTIPSEVEQTKTAPRRQPNLAPAPRDLSISLPQAIKEFVTRSELPSPADETKGDPSQMNGDIPRLLGTLMLASKIEGLRIRKDGGNVMGLVWSGSELFIFDITDDSVLLRCSVASQGLLEVIWVDESTIRAFYLMEIISYKIPPVSSNVSSEPLEVVAVTKLRASEPTSASKSVLEHVARRQLYCVDIATSNHCISALSHMQSKSHPADSQPLVIWSSSETKQTSVSTVARLTALLPLELSSFICGYDNGQIRRCSLKGLVGEEWQTVSSKRTMRSFALLNLFATKNLRTDEQFTIGGGDDGSISIWDMKSLRLRARWIIFTEPLKRVIPLEADATGRLRGCCLAVSGDGTIAIIAIDGFNLVYIVPGSPAPLRTICLNTDNLLLFYADNRTRLWDVRTHEFRRSITSEKATELLSQGDWVITDVQDDHTEVLRSGSLAAVNKAEPNGEPSPCIVFSVDGVTNNTDVGNPQRNKMPHTDIHRALLSALHTSGLDEHIDPVFVEYTGKQVMKRVAEVSIYDADQNLQEFYIDSAHAAWQISGEVTVVRLLAILTILKTEASSSVHERSLDALILFYSAALPMVVGPLYRSPNLAILMHYRHESKVAEVRSAAMKLSECELARLSNDEITATVEIWQHTLPCLLPEAEKQTDKAALSLSLCGNIAIEKYNLLSTTTLTDIAKSITLYLYDERSPHRTLAIELCSRGFEIWQQYFDAMEALRSLFTLATTSRKESISVRNPGPHARMAVLHIAEGNSPLFMTTLSLDILHPRSVEYNKSIMQIIAFLIKKKPLVLYPNLPRLMEAVVKSLDPGSNGDREAVLDTVTEIIALVVQTFPTIDFHTGSQRLAVGTSEGAVIMYDLKTATRLYVLEGHRKRLAGLSFSPDGRRVVTVSLEESLALVWKVGSSFVSFFHPGAPPRQGRSGSEPFKTLNFVLKDEAVLSVESTLKQIHFSWPSDRSVKIDVSDATFTFST